MNNKPHIGIRQIILSGLVQGVGFRYFTLHAAKRLSICGYVRNLQNGTVEVIAAGATGSIERFLEQLRLGPPSSQVERCEVHPKILPDYDLGEFTIR